MRSCMVEVFIIVQVRIGRKHRSGPNRIFIGLSKVGSCGKAALVLHVQDRFYAAGAACMAMERLPLCCSILLYLMQWVGGT